MYCTSLVVVQPDANSRRELPMSMLNFDFIGLIVNLVLNKHL